MWAPSSSGVSRINTAVGLYIFSPHLLTLRHPFFSTLSLENAPSPVYESLSISPVQMFGPAEATAADMVRRPGAKWWRSPAWTGMLTFHPSPSVEEHLFDLRCDCVFSSPHLQLPLDHALPPTFPSSGLSLINC